MIFYGRGLNGLFIIIDRMSKFVKWIDELT